MSEDITEGHALTTQLLKLINVGNNLNQIAEKMEISPIKAHAIWQEYVDNRLVLPFEHQWILHLDRLEGLLQVAHQVLEKDMDSDSVEATLKILDRIEDMQALALSRKEKAQQDMVQLTKQQTMVMLQVISSVQAHYREALSSVFEQKTYKGARELALNGFDEMFRASTQKALEEVRNDEI